MTISRIRQVVLVVGVAVAAMGPAVAKGNGPWYLLEGTISHVREARGTVTFVLSGTITRTTHEDPPSRTQWTVEDFSVRTVQRYFFVEMSQGADGRWKGEKAVHQARELFGYLKQAERRRLRIRAEPNLNHMKAIAFREERPISLETDFIRISALEVR